MLFEFQQKGIHGKKELQANLKTVYQSFDMNHQFLKKLSFEDDYSMLYKTYDGDLWVRQLFLYASANTWVPRDIH